MAFRDNREFIAALEKSGDVVRINQEVDWDLEVGAIVRRVCERRAPAPFFESIKGYPAGYRIFGAPLATARRLAVAMGLDPDTPYVNIQAEYERRLEKPVKPVVVKDAPCKENVIQGDRVDLFQFPAPMIHEGDGGRYLGTWHAVISKDRDSEWTNWGMYRLMLLAPRLMTGHLEVYTHQWVIWNRGYISRNENMPIAVAIGLDPLCSLASAARSFGSRSEVDYAGALRQEPVELIKCETNDLLVPAHAEIVLEGELLTGVSGKEGPFGEYPGYRSDPRESRRVYRINAITHRNDPILTMTCVGMPQDDNALIRGLDMEVLAKRLLRRHRVPFTNLHIPAESANFAAVVAVRPGYSGVATQIGNILAAAQLDPGKKVIVVEDDVDVFNLGEVFHAFATTCHPGRGIRVYDKEVEPSPLTPYLSPDDRKWGRGSRVVIDCTWPVEWSREKEVPPRMSFNKAYPREITERVVQNWADYGFE